MGELIVREQCRAKLNLYLAVVGRRSDGYHDLVTVFHEVDLADDLDVQRSDGAPGTVSLDVQVPDGADVSEVPTDSRNLAVRAAKALLAEAGRRDAIALRLVKRIPAGGGLGGGSADAAGTLRAVSRLLGLGASDEDLERIGLTLGSDVPFLVRGGTAIGRGRGEILERVAVGARPSFRLFVPAFGVSTAAVYAALPRALAPAREVAPVLEALASGDAEALSRSCWNALTQAAVSVEPRLAAALAAARAASSRDIHLSGSGSTLFTVLPATLPLTTPAAPAPFARVVSVS